MTAARPAGPSLTRAGHQGASPFQVAVVQVLRETLTGTRGVRISVTTRDGSTTTGDLVSVSDAHLTFDDGYRLRTADVQALRLP